MAKKAPKKQKKVVDVRATLNDMLSALQYPFHNLEHARMRERVIMVMIGNLLPFEQERFDREKTDLLVDCVYFSLLGYLENPMNGESRESQSLDAFESRFGNSYSSQSRESVKRTLRLGPYGGPVETDERTGSRKRRMLTVAQKIYLLSDDYAFACGWDMFVEERLKAYAESRVGQERSVDDFLEMQMRLVKDHLRPMVVAMEDMWDRGYYRSLLMALDTIDGRIASVRDDVNVRGELEARLRPAEVDVPV